MGDLEDSIRRQNEQHDEDWKPGDRVTVGDGVATGVFVGMRVMGSIQVRIVESKKPDVFIAGRVYDIPNAEAHHQKA
jgi:hypothetical protein